MKKEKTKRTKKMTVALLSVMILCAMIVPQAAFADGTSPSNVPTYLTTKENTGISVTDIVVSESLVMVSDGTDGKFGAGKVSITNNNTVGSISVDSISYKDNATVSGWTLTSASKVTPGIAINSRKYSLMVEVDDKDCDLSSSVTVKKGDLLAEPKGTLDLSFSGNLSAVTSDWTKVPIGKVILTLSLYQEDEVFQIRTPDGSTLRAITDDGTLYAEGGETVDINVSNIGEGKISNVTVKNLKTNAAVELNTIIDDSKFRFTMPEAPIMVEATITPK